jgi:hypothetical protein
MWDESERLICRLLPKIAGLAATWIKANLSFCTSSQHLNQVGAELRFVTLENT